MTIDKLRASVVSEALSWKGTPYHMGGMLKGIGADCASFILSVYKTCGIFTDDRSEYFAEDWWRHTTEEKYAIYVLRHAIKVLDSVCSRSVKSEPGNIILVKAGGSRVFNHGAIIIDFPRGMHAISPEVNEVNLVRHPLWTVREISIYDPFVGVK